MNNKELIEKAVYAIKEAKDSVDKLNEIFEELKRAYDNNELSIDSEEMQPILKWVIVISKEDALRKAESILKEVYWRNEPIKKEKEADKVASKKHTILKSLEL